MPESLNVTRFNAYLCNTLNVQSLVTQTTLKLAGIKGIIISCITCTPMTCDSDYFGQLLPVTLKSVLQDSGLSVALLSP